MQSKFSTLTSAIIAALCVANVVGASALPDVEVVSDICVKVEEVRLTDQRVSGFS
uniref:Uncharacterized protein n=1 Tax=Moniliophthora roreri TaxID=221103 RepID=A0A0W0FTI6_MONRR